MNTHPNPNNLIRQLEIHLRKISRQLINIDTEEQTIQFLIDAFMEKIYCDFIGVALVENNQFISKAWGGEAGDVEQTFPLEVNSSTVNFLRKSLKDEDAYQLVESTLTTELKKSAVKTWFTVPLIDGTKQYGFCIVGFYNYVPLLEMYDVFDEFGKDVAVAIAMIRRRERRLEKIEDLGWVRNFSIDKTLEENVREFTFVAASGMKAQSACFYLLDEKKGYFQLQLPVYGDASWIEKIIINQNKELKDYFPFLEKVGEKQLAMPIVIDLKTIGVLHVADKKDGSMFSSEDRSMLRLLADYISALLENKQLYNKEREQREKLQLLLDYQQALVKETIVHHDFHGVTKMLSDMFHCSVVLLDRFIRPITFHLMEEDKEELTPILQLSNCNEEPLDVFRRLKEIGFMYSSWSIDGVNSRLGYLVIGIDRLMLDEFDLLTVNLARNISSIQFIKQKLVLDANEQAKETFMGKLLSEQIADKKDIIQYANLFQWDIYKAHRVVSVSIELAGEKEKELNLLEQKTKKSQVWDYLANRTVAKYKGILTATYQESYLLIVRDEKNKEHFWSGFYHDISEAVAGSDFKATIYLGIGKVVTEVNQYYASYTQSLQALNVVKSRFKKRGYALFEGLGSYTILDQLDSPAVAMFLEQQLSKLITYSVENDIDLLDTLRVYLTNNGNARSTADQLFLHRSSFLYRLDRIEELLEVDLNDSENRFNLMMAFKLYDMIGTTQ